MIDAARQLFINHNNVMLHRGDATSLPYHNDYFDYVISASLINITDNPDMILAEMTRVLRSQGRLLFLVPSENMDKNTVSMYIQKNRLTGFSAQALKTWNKLANKMNTQRCQELIRNAGLQGTEIEDRLDGMVYIVTGIKP